MKIRHRLKRCVVLGTILVALGAVGFAGWHYVEGIKGVNAREGQDEIESELLHCEEVGGCDELLGEAEEELQDQLINNEITPVVEGEGDLLDKYDLRDEFAVRQKNQHSEGMCWLYSSVTALEYSLAKKYEDYEVSVKHLDYMTVDGAYVYNQLDKTNVYFDRYMNGGGYHRWSLGTSGASSELIYSVLNPLAIMSESDFTEVLKENDSRLASINRYEDIWSLANKNEILENNADGYPSYSKRQDYDKVNDPSKVKYIVTGAKLGGYAFDGARTADSDVVKTIKNIINQYGAVKISAFGTTDRFNNCSYKKVENGKTLYTFIIDGRIDQANGIKCTANHGMTIVGWDDNWEYEYNNTTGRGAFVLQNSWSEGEGDKMKWHLSYTSALSSLMYFDSVERYTDYDRYYGVEDYKEQTITPANDEYIFEFSLDGSEEIKAFVFSELYGPYEYDVYVSNTGRASDFRKDGRFTSESGITKYEFNNEYDITSDYAIKIKRVNGRAKSDAERARGTMNVMSRRVEAPAGPDDTDTPVPAAEDEEDLPVPNTSVGKPDTGGNANSVDGGSVIVLFILPVVIVGGVMIRRRNTKWNRRRKFEW